MAEDANKRIAELQQQRELMQWMIDNQKRVNNGVSAHLKARKELYEYTQMLQIAEKSFAESSKVIKELEEKRIKLSKEEELNLRQLNKDLKKKVDTIGEEVTKLKKTLSIRQALTKEVEKGVKALYNEIFGTRKLVNLYLEMDKAVRSTSVSIGLTGGASAMFRENMLGSAMAAARFNISLAEIARIQSDLASGTGTASILTEEDMERFGVMSKLFGNVGGFAADMELFGYGAGQSADEFEKIFQTAQEYGLDAQKYTKNIANNLKLMTKYRFRGGLTDLKEATALTQRMRQDMSAFSGFAEKVMRPEGAIEAAAALQVLGGAMGRLGDPFMLMSKARNDMAGFTKEVMAATIGVGVFNVSTGKFDITANELDRLRELAKITGQSFDDLTVQAREQAQDKRIRAEITASVSKKDMTYLSGLTQIDKEGGMFIEVRGKEKDLSKITAEDVEYLKQEGKTMEEMAKLQMTFKDNLDSIVKMLQLTLLPAMEYLGEIASDWSKRFADASDSVKENMAYGIIGMAALFSVATMFAAGASMGAGFKMGSGAMGMVGRGLGMGGGGATALSASAARGAGTGARARLMGTAVVIAAIGVSVMMIGKGVQLATDGFANMATAMSSLPLTHLVAFESVVNSILIGFGSFVVIVGALAFALATSAVVIAPVTPILLGVGASMLMMGAGIGIAAAGMSLLITSINEGKDVGITLIAIAAGMGGLLLATTAFANPLTAIGLAAAMLSLYGISKMGPALSQAGVGIKMVSDNLLTLKTNLKAFGDGSGLSEVVGSLKELQNITQTAPIRVEVGGKVDGTVNVEVAGSDFKKDLLRDSFFLEELTSKIEQRVTLRDNTSGL
mgnify:FL=1|jgi:hypothetical protein|tara:strand:+ start:8803 stop:11343 length:2541 start_codon:yes stop_codon:yes gene_type:complete